MRLGLVAFTCALLCSGWLGTAEAADYVYYVDPVNGTGSGDGSQISPFVAISEALNDVTDTDSVAIYLAPGEYTGEGNIGLYYRAATVRVFGSGASGSNESSIDCGGTGIGMIVNSADFAATNVSISTCQTGIIAQMFAVASLGDVVIRDMPGTGVVLQETYTFICDHCKFSNIRYNSISGTVYTFGLASSELSGPAGAGVVGGGISLWLHFTGSVENCTFSEVVGLIGSSVSTQALKLTGGIWSMNGNLFDGCALRLNPDSPPPENAGLFTTDVSSLGGTLLFQDPDSLGSLTLTNSSFISSFSYGNGGALAVVQGAVVNVDNVLFDGNRATNGGGMFIGSNTTVTMTNSVLSFNEAKENGGGMFVQDTGVVYLDRCVFDFNSAGVSASDLACCSNSTAACSATIYSTSTTVMLDDDQTTCTIYEWQMGSPSDGDDEEEYPTPSVW